MISVFLREQKRYTQEELVKEFRCSEARPGSDPVQAGGADLEAQAPQAEGLQLCPIAASSGPRGLFTCL